MPDNIIVLQETGVSWQISKLADKEKGDQHPVNKKLTGDRRLMAYIEASGRESLRGPVPDSILQETGVS